MVLYGRSGTHNDNNTEISTEANARGRVLLRLTDYEQCRRLAVNIRLKASRRSL